MFHTCILLCVTFLVIQDKNDVDVEKMKSTLILCYGYVALHAPEDKLLTRIDSDILHNISKNFNTKVKQSGILNWYLFIPLKFKCIVLWLLVFLVSCHMLVYS